MKFSVAATTLLAGQAYAACSQVSSSEGNALSVVESCPANGVLFRCPTSGAEVESTSRQNIFVISSVPKAVTLKVTTRSVWSEDPIADLYYFCEAGSNEERAISGEAQIVSKVQVVA